LLLYIVNLQLVYLIINSYITIYNKKKKKKIIYIKLKSTNLCKNILRAIKVGDMPELENFPVAQQATFHYYCGLLNFLDEQYHEVSK